MAIKLNDPWWLTDKYVVDALIPDQMRKVESGPKGIALVKLWKSGKTSKSWGLESKPGKPGEPGFMENYVKGAFNARRVEHGYNNGQWAAAFVMRSLNVVAIDIDGKNGGIDHAEELLAGAPPTLAETSKSGAGYHLFYLTNDTWSDELGFGMFDDRLGIVQGVDIRAVGCIFHHKTQRWNDREIAPLPQYVADRLRQYAESKRAVAATIEKTLQAGDPDEILLMQQNLIDDLKRPLKKGMRNATLFAIGTQMKLAQVPNWERLIEEKAAAVDLPAYEIDKLVRNIQNYGK